MNRFLLSSILSGIVLSFSCVMPAFAEQLEEQLQDAVEERLETREAVKSQAIVYDSKPMIAMLEKGKVGVIALQDPEGIYNFYKARSFEPFWMDGKKPSTRTEKAIEVLGDAWTHGLNPENYHLSTLKKVIESGVTEPDSFEIVMSDAVARYGRDLTGMRLSARSLGEDMKSWVNGIKAESLLNHLTQNTNSKKALEDLAPQTKIYNELRDGLKKLLEDIKENPDRNRAPIAYPGLLRPGTSHPAIKLIRTRFDIAPKNNQAPEQYDEKLVEKIMEFQKDNGLKPDGIIGQRTIEAINQGRRDRLVKLVANLERLRWLDPEMPSKYIVVNVPAMSLRAYEDGKTAFEMPVIVGKDSWPTTSFRTDITGIRFNPSWYVPPSIKTKEILPELRKDANALAKKNLELLYYTSDGAKPVSPRDINWAAMTEADFKNFAVIQNPGDENPLGKIRVLMPNQYNIYLHDTNSPDLFTKDFRALSHGCIRLAEPRRVANFILDTNKNWSEERLEGILAKKNTIEIASETRLPVFILYQTIWEDNNGKLIYGQDIYKSDEKLVSELANKGKIPFPIN